MGDCSSSAVNGTGYSFNNGSANMNNNGYTHHTNNMNTNISNYSTFNQNSQSPITANPNSRNPTQPQQPTQSQTKHKVLTNKPPLYSNLSASFTSSSSNAAVMGGQGKTPGNSVNGSTNKK
jgi:hypothetical protein